MRLLKKLLLNRFIFSIIILIVFAFDYKMYTIEPLRFYSFEKPQTLIANEYYEVEFGAPSIYVQVFYEGNKIHLVPTSIPPILSELYKPLIAWYYYLGALVIVNIFPFSIFHGKKRNRKK